MKILLSPAMNMIKGENSMLDSTMPIFVDRACELVEEIKKINLFDLEISLGISPKLLEKVFVDYCEFDCIDYKSVGTQAIVSFKGLAYKNINVEDFTENDFSFANEKLRILSSLYGVLKPTDLIQPYRLDFMCNFAKNKIDGKNLYEYWGSDVYEEIFKDNEIVIGICSNEYEKLIKPFLKPSDKYISCKFLLNKNGKLVAQATSSKMARGKMARFIVKNKIEDIKKLEEFEFDGFSYSDDYSNKNTLVFIK